MGLRDVTLYDLIRRNAAAFGGRPAWIDADDGRTLSFGAIAERVERLAAGLQRRGVRPGDRLGVCGKNSLEFFLLYGAAAACGAIVLPINWRLSAAEAVFNLADGRPRLLFVDAEYQEMVGAHRGRLPSVEACFNLKPPGGGFEPFDGLLEPGAAFAPVDAAGDDGWTIIHTAAVAGRPRGAIVSHRNLVCAAVQLNLLLQMSPADVHLNLLPLFHVGGLFMAVQAVCAGALNVNMGRFDAAAAAELIERHGATVLFDFSPILEGILDRHESDGRALGTLRKVIGLERPEVIERYRKLTGGTFYCMYGQTETAAIATFGRSDERPGSAGRPVPFAQVALLDEDDRPVATGAVGEIAVRGPLVFAGYWDLPEDTARTFRGGWHHTGDLGRFDADGYLFYAGRKPEKELIKPGGENVYPAEVEAAILEHPDVERAVVFGVPDPKWKEAVKAVCQLKPGRQLAAADLVAFVGGRIASFKKPRHVEFVAAIPLAADGSPDRQQVKDAHGGGQG
ncbi:MAG: AMP-binding protein [Desulfobacterales bacterium]|nr:AMP-binding protein [Desulfobacterales bacterium]